MSQLDALIADAIRANLPDHPSELGPEEAQKLAAEGWERTVSDAIAFVAKQVVSESAARVAERKRAEEREHEAERDRAETAKKARKVWERLFGKEIAAKLRAERAYWLAVLHGEGEQTRTYAFSDKDAIPPARRTLESAAAGFRVEILGERGRRVSDARGMSGERSALDEDQGTPGVGLGVITQRRGLRLSGVDPDSEELAALIRGREQARGAAESAKAERDRERREREREERTFGAPVSE